MGVRIEDRPPKEIKGEELKKILSYNFQELTLNDIDELLVNKIVRDENGKPQIHESPFKSYDDIEIPPGHWRKNTKPFKTKLGCYMINKYLLEQFEFIPYQDVVFDAGEIKFIDRMMAEAILTKKITTKEVIRGYIDKCQWMFTPTDGVCSSMTPKTAKVLPKVAEVKAARLKKMKDVNNVEEYAKLEKELLDIAKDELKDNIGMALYDSGSNASFKNNYKSMYISKGPIRDITTGEYKTITSNFTDGVTKEELQPHFDASVTGSYAKGKNTALSGYETKKILAALQAVTLGKEGSDCGTTKTLDIVLKPFYKEWFLYMYIVENGKLVLLTPSNIGKYVNKRIHVRFPMFCTDKHICSVCSGKLYHMEGFKNAGLTAARISTVLQDKSMKKFHDTSIKIKPLDIDDIIIS